jgi:hypothetical protein
MDRILNRKRGAAGRKFKKIRVAFDAPPPIIRTVPCASKGAENGGSSSMVELRTVAPVVAGSSPVSHPDELG